ncbi:MAG: acyl-CoA thioesterase II [Gemmatimonadetes bacterium]|nr:acyl-CoA thioesterase II [Gemmatimonadota bacterium]
MASSTAILPLLDLEPIERNIYRGRNRDIGSGRIFGGQVLAQALVAARRTVAEEDRTAHSLHGYFILAGDLSIPVVYFVDRTRDGRSFSTRRVTAIQHGKAIFALSASFHRAEEGISHQTPMAEVPPPEELRGALEIMREHTDRIPEHLRDILTQDRPFDFRHVETYVPFDRTPRPPVRHVWLRTTEPLGDAPVHHQAALAYASDYGILSTALYPHGRTGRDPDLMVASLDHSLWFHRPFRTDEWLLYRVESPVSHGARGFGFGSVHTRSGDLVASAAQEGLLRTGIRPRGGGQRVSGR